MQPTFRTSQPTSNLIDNPAHFKLLRAQQLTTRYVAAVFLALKVEQKNI